MDQSVTAQEFMTVCKWNDSYGNSISIETQDNKHPYAKD